VACISRPAYLGKACRPNERARSQNADKQSKKWSPVNSTMLCDSTGERHCARKIQPGNAARARNASLQGSRCLQPASNLQPLPTPHILAPINGETHPPLHIPRRFDSIRAPPAPTRHAAPQAHATSGEFYCIGHQSHSLYLPHAAPQLSLPTRTIRLWHLPLTLEGPPPSLSKPPRGVPVPALECTGRQEARGTHHAALPPSIQLGLSEEGLA
jgi:hypothetical protein